MKLKIFNFTKSNLNIKMNCNKPIKSSIKIPNNMPTKPYSTIEQKLVKVTDLIIKKLQVIESNNDRLLKQLKKLV